MSLGLFKNKARGTWVGSVRQPILGFSSDHDLLVVRLSPTLGSVVTLESASDFLSLWSSPTQISK